MSTSWIAAVAICLILAQPATERSRRTVDGQQARLAVTLPNRQGDECPDAQAYLDAPQRRVELPTIASDTVWDYLRNVLDSWHSADSGAASELPILMENSPSAQKMMIAPQALSTARTCFMHYESSKNTENQLALWFAVDSAAPMGSTLTIRWLGFFRGRGERRWQADQRWSTRRVSHLVNTLAGRSH